MCELPPQLAKLPIAFEDPVYGSNEPTFTEFMAPGVILSITYFMAVGLTALSFIIERKEGLLERSWVAGVTATEVMLAHVVAQFAVMVVQVWPSSRSKNQLAFSPHHRWPWFSSS